MTIRSSSRTVRAGAAGPVPCRGRVLPLLLALALSFEGGCGSGVTSSGYPVSGNVRWKGRPLDRGTIQFLPAVGPGSMVGTEIEGGRYTLPNPPGLVPGTYRVRVSSRGGAGPDTGRIRDADLSAPGARELIPPGYNEDTTLKAEVTAAGPKTFDFDLVDEGTQAGSPRAAR